MNYGYLVQTVPHPVIAGGSIHPSQRNCAKHRNFAALMAAGAGALQALKRAARQALRSSL